MNFSKYYDSEHFTASKMHTRAAVAITHKDYQPPSDIQLFYLLEIISDFAALGYCEFKFSNQYIDIHKEVYNKLRELGYTIEEDAYTYTVTIRWNY